MIFAIDYDSTLTAAPELISKFARDIKAAGHQPILLSLRENTEGNIREINEALDRLDCQMPVVLTSREWKDAAAKRCGYYVDIFLDDMPETIRERYSQGFLKSVEMQTKPGRLVLLRSDGPIEPRSWLLRVPDSLGLQEARDEYAKYQEAGGVLALGPWAEEFMGCEMVEFEEVGQW